LCKNITILGLGNILLKDEGVGVWIAEEIARRSLPDNVEIIDGGTAGLDILTSMKDVDKLIIIDALQGNEKPGTVYRLHPEDVPAPSDSYVSVHQMNILEGLSIAQKTGNAPQETVIIGVEPEEMDWGLGVTPDIKQKFPEIIDIVLEEVKNDCYRKEANN
ncbi:MAG TPA: HyaD/HybD family hydrogenase maturation endopeptidase, partial [Anaerolineae bacterium]|nr:HyaD/HybD family hydrogenase maturation endopeptidase [Anaerolineae bacterium]